jgi:hypothetical protein
MCISLASCSAFGVETSPNHMRVVLEFEPVSSIQPVRLAGG